MYSVCQVREIADGLGASEIGLFALKTPSSSVYRLPNTQTTLFVRLAASHSSTSVMLLKTAPKCRFKLTELLFFCFVLFCFFHKGGDEWRQLAERLGMSYNEIRFLDKRTTNPCDVVLDLMANHRYLSVGEIYDKLVESELPGSADLL